MSTHCMLSSKKTSVMWSLSVQSKEIAQKLIKIFPYFFYFLCSLRKFCVQTLNKALSTKKKNVGIYLYVSKTINHYVSVFVSGIINLYLFVYLES